MNNIARVALLVLVAGFGCDDGYPVGPTDPAAVTALQLTYPSATALRVGDVAQLSLTVRLSTGAEQDQTRAAAWSSNDISVATVSETGLVRGVGPGTAIIRADFRGLSSFQPVEVIR